MSEDQAPYQYPGRYEFYKPCGCAQWKVCDHSQAPGGETEAGAILRQVANIVDGARNRTHGNKERSFAGIAKGWRRAFGWEVRPSDVALAQVIVKEQRMRHGEHSPEALRQHVEDILGYWAIFYELRRLEGSPDLSAGQDFNSAMAEVWQKATPMDEFLIKYPVGSTFYGPEGPEYGVWLKRHDGRETYWVRDA